MKRTFTAGLAALMLIGLAAPAYAEPKAAPIPKAVVADPPRDVAHPANMATFHRPDRRRAGERHRCTWRPATSRNPTMLMLHGFPGNETNIDLMQARASGRLERDADQLPRLVGQPRQVLVRGQPRRRRGRPWPSCATPANVAKYRIDPTRIVVAGHSMGGFMAASAVAADPKAAGAILIDAWDIGKRKADLVDPAKRKAALEELRTAPPPWPEPAPNCWPRRSRTTSTRARPGGPRAPASPTGRC